MSQPALSRTTLADVLSAIDASTLGPIQKRDQASAVRSLTRLLNAQPGDIPADPARLRQRLDGLAPTALGISAGRWRNLRSLLGKALSLIRTVQPGRSNDPIAPIWEALLAGVEYHRGIRLKPLLRFLTAQGRLPADIGVDHLEAYHAAIVDDRLRARPEQTWNDLIWSWNACVRQMPGWPQVEIARLVRREIYILPWSDFPPSLTADVDAWVRRQSGADLSEDGPPKPLRPSSLKTRVYQLRVAASALVLRGVDPADIRTLADIVTLERFKLVLQFFLDRHGGVTSPQVGQMASFLKGVADHWAGLDDVTLFKMKQLVGRLLTNERKMTVKNRRRLRPFDDAKTVRAFLDLPDRIRADVEKDKRPAKLKAIRAQMAVAIALLQAAPVRIGNLANIDMARHLIGRGDQMYLVIEEAEVKNAEPIDFVLPQNVVDLLVWYATTYRACLVRQPNQALFPGAGAGPKSTHGLGAQITKVIGDYTGLDFNPHLARHLGGKIFLDQRPGEYEVVRRVLGHKSIATTTAIYTGAETASAGQHYAKVLDGLRTRKPNHLTQRHPPSQAPDKADGR